jgi:hypothetical protein
VAARTLAFQTRRRVAARINGEPEAAWPFYHVVPDTGSLNGHLTLMPQPERVTAPTAARWRMMFDNDAASRAHFVGSSCGLCGQASEFEHGEHGLEGGD